MSSMDYLFLDERVLIHLGDVLSRIDLVVACLGQWHDQATSEAAARQHCHNAEVEQHSGVGVHLLSACDPRVSQLGTRLRGFI